MTEPKLTLSEALRSDRLAQFISEAEAAGVAAVDKAEFEEAVRLVATPPQQSDRTSRSPSGDGSTGK